MKYFLPTSLCVQVCSEHYVCKCAVNIMCASVHVILEYHNVILKYHNVILKYHNVILEYHNVILEYHNAMMKYHNYNCTPNVVFDTNNASYNVTC